MFRRLQTIATGGGNLLRSEGTIVVERLRRALVLTALLAVSIGVLVVGLLALLVAAGAAIATELSWIWAVAIIGACVTFIAAICVIAFRVAMSRQLQRSAMPDEQLYNAAHAKQEIAEAVPGVSPPHETAQPHSGTQPSGMQDRVAKFISDHPLEVAAGTVAIVGAIGPFRVLKLMSRGAMLAGLAQSVMKHAGSGSGSSARPTPSAPPPPPPQAARRTPAARPAGPARHASPVGPHTSTSPPVGERHAEYKPLTRPPRPAAHRQP